MLEATSSYIEPYEDFEIIEGVKYMSPAANPRHGTIINNLFFEFKKYANEHRELGVGIFTDNIEIRLNKNNVIRPDLSVVCNSIIVQIDKALFGLPDLAVEVLSPSTAKHDRNVKKELYERNGVREYWIIDPKNKSVEVYHLVNEKLVLDEIYYGLSDAEIEGLPEEDIKAIKYDISVSILPDLIIDIREIFKWWWNI